MGTIVDLPMSVNQECCQSVSAEVGRTCQFVTSDMQLTDYQEDC
jgi:hypothetical protein